jgi:hypothetical protein
MKMHGPGNIKNGLLLLQTKQKKMLLLTKLIDRSLLA